MKLGGLPTEVLVCQELEGVDLLVGANMCSALCVHAFTTTIMTLGEKR